MGRRTEGLPVVADYAVWTLDLNREELMIILNGQRTHRVNQAKRILQSLRANKDKSRRPRQDCKPIKNQYNEKQAEKE